MRKILALMFIIATVLLAPIPAAHSQTAYGDTNIEVATANLIAQNIEALTKFKTAQQITIHSISMYLQYQGSDGSECLKFGIYGYANPPMGQPLVAATTSGYCLQTGDFGPAWETFTLQPSDSMTVPPGTYWISVLASPTATITPPVTIYHYAYTGEGVNVGAENMYTYGYFGGYAFPASYTQGFPPVPFAEFGEWIINNSESLNAPFSVYVST
jgi:hypothetical protein